MAGSCIKVVFGVSWDVRQRGGGGGGGERVQVRPRPLILHGSRVRDASASKSRALCAEDTLVARVTAGAGDIKVHVLLLPEVEFLSLSDPATGKTEASAGSGLTSDLAAVAIAAWTVDDLGSPRDMCREGRNE